jgi:hypothetical protein
MYVSVISASPLPGYKVRLGFDNGEQRILDMSPYLGKGVYKGLKDMMVFNSVRVVFDSIEWSNGADFEPELLYELSSQ